MLECHYFAEKLYNEYVVSQYVTDKIDIQDNFRLNVNVYFTIYQEPVNVAYHPATYLGMGPETEQSSVPFIGNAIISGIFHLLYPP